MRKQSVFSAKHVRWSREMTVCASILHWRISLAGNKAEALNALRGLRLNPDSAQARFLLEGFSEKLIPSTADGGFLPEPDDTEYGSSTHGSPSVDF